MGCEEAFPGSAVMPLLHVFSYGLQLLFIESLPRPDTSKLVQAA